MDILIIAGFCIVSTIFCKLLEKDCKEMKILLVLSCLCVIFIKTSGIISDIFSEIKSLCDTSGIDGQYVKILFKALGICCITQFSADYCKDCGENALASQVEFGGKIALIITAFPMFESLINIVKKLLE